MARKKKDPTPVLPVVPGTPYLTPENSVWCPRNCQEPWAGGRAPLGRISPRMADRPGAAGARPFDSTRHGRRHEDHRERAVFSSRAGSGRVTDEDDRPGSLITQVFPGAVGDLEREAIRQVGETLLLRTSQ